MAPGSWTQNEDPQSDRSSHDVEKDLPARMADTEPLARRGAVRLHHRQTYSETVDWREALDLAA
jgi:hypothetical protein